MNCQPSLQLSPPRSLVTQPLRPLTPSDELPQHTKWHRQQDSSSSTPEIQALSSNSSSTAPNLNITGSNYNLKSTLSGDVSSVHCTVYSNLFIYKARDSSIVPAGFLIAQFLQKL